MLKKVVLLVTLFVLVCSTIFIINQTAQVVSLANTISPTLGRAVLGALLAVYSVVILVSIALFIRLPKPMTPPADEQSPEYQTYLRQLGVRLAANPHLPCAGPLNDRPSIESALKILNAEADKFIRDAASTLFVATAVSQSGDLDALMVLAEQTLLIRRVAHIYNQRPTLRDFGRLYANVGAALFTASKLEDLNLSGQIAPVIHAVIGQTIAHPGSIPGASVVMPAIEKAGDIVASIVMQSVLKGTGNAYMTLRVGIICKRYCGSITAIDRKEAHHSASIAAASMLGSIVSSSAASVIKAIVTGAKKAGQSGVESAVANAMKAGQSGVEFALATAIKASHSGVESAASAMKAGQSGAGSMAARFRGAASKLNRFKAAPKE